MKGSLEQYTRVGPCLWGWGQESHRLVGPRQGCWLGHGFGVMFLLPPFSQITRRYAEFSSALVSINQTIPSERTLHLLGQLQVRGVGGRPTAGLRGGLRCEAQRCPPLPVSPPFCFCRWKWRTLCSEWPLNSPQGRSSLCF